MEHATDSEQPAPIWLLGIMLIVSGSCALVFQVVWVRELRLVFGATTAASAAVLAIFMAGLGLGNGLLGRRIDRSLRPLRFYGRLEAGIALSAATSPFLIDLARAGYIASGGQAELGSTLAVVVRLLASAVILAVPTFLMGGTLPAAARAVSLDTDLHRRGVALLYGVNTLGAVAGAALANFLLLEHFGSRAVLWSACGLNLLLAASALWLSQRLCHPAAKKPVPHARPRRAQRLAAKDSPEQQPAHVGIVYFSSGMVGFAFFLMEIVWYRMLGPLLGGTTYTFGLILCIALLGIGLGGTIYSLAARCMKPSLPLLALTCAVEALSIAVPYWYGDQLALWVLRQALDSVASFADQVWNWFQVGAFVILPASLVAGFQFPLLIAIAGSGRQDVGKHVGLTCAANTVGAIAGSLAGGFLLLPILTAPGLWQVVVWLLVLLSLGIALRGRKWKQLSLGLAAAASILAVAGTLQTGPTAVWRHAGIGAGRADMEGAGPNAEREFVHAKIRQCVWEAEGVESSVAITATDSLAFIVNGKSDGNAYSDAGTQIGLALIGPLLHKSPRQALVIGLGTGESAGWLADMSGMTAVDVVELEPTIVTMAEQCAAVNREPLKNPKLHLHYNDAREFLLTGREEYDLIVSEPSNPYRSGIANLYTHEFYLSAASRLTEEGLFLQWLQGYEVDDSTVKIVLQTLRAVFPHVQIWRTKSRDMVLVCSKTAAALQSNAQSLRERMQQPTLREGLRLAWGVQDLEGALAHYVCGDRTIDSFLGQQDLPLNTDDRNLLEYAFAKTVGQTTRFSIQELHLLALQGEDDVPVPRDEVNLEALTRRRLAMHLFLGGFVPLDEQLSGDLRTRAEAYNHYLAKRYAPAAESFRRIRIDPTCLIEALVLSHTLAETGSPIPAEIMESIRANSPAEAAAVETVLLWKQNQREAALKSLLATFELLRSDPWSSQQLIDAVLRVAGNLAEGNPKVAAQMFEQLSKPLAMYRVENKRLLIRYLIAEQVDEQHMLQALAALEPYVPWKGWILENRAQLYLHAGHPRAAAAARDLQQFQTWERLKE